MGEEMFWGRRDRVCTVGRDDRKSKQLGMAMGKGEEA